MATTHLHPYASTTNPFATADDCDAFENNSALEYRSNNPFECEEESSSSACTYVMTRKGPGLDAEQVECSDALSVEIIIAWGESVLHVQHLTPPRDFYVGEEEKHNIRCDYFLPHEQLGATRAPVVLVEPEGTIRLVVLPGATGWVELPAHGKTQLERLVATGAAQPCVEHHAAHAIVLPPGSRARMQVKDIVFTVGVVRPARKSTMGGLFQRDWSTAAYVALSMAVHCGILAAIGLFMPPLGLVDEQSVNEDQLYVMQQYLRASAEREQVVAETKDTTPGSADGSTAPADNQGGTEAKGTNTPGRGGPPAGLPGGTTTTPTAQQLQSQAHADAQTFGAISLLSGLPTAGAPQIWGTADTFPGDPTGIIWSSSPETFEVGGLPISNGPQGDWVPSKGVRTIYDGKGTCKGPNCGGYQGVKGTPRPPKAPQVRMGATTVNGAIPAAVIQRIVRQNYGRFRMCYEAGLRTNPSLQGRVAVRFVIGQNGAVSVAQNGGSDLPDPNVVQCVVGGFRGLSFPQPDNGIVTVVYPIMFSPAQ